MNGNALKPGYYDLNADGVIDTVAFTYGGKAAMFISEDGKLPWETEPECGWDRYFHEAFNAGKDMATWNDIRLGWGNFTLLIDKDDCGRFDSLGDYCYRSFDLNGDGVPEAEYYHLFPGEDWCPYSNKFVVNFNGEPDMSFLDFEKLTYGDEQKYDEGGKYRMNVHGSGLFVNSYSAHPELSWETPISWYDFDCDGKTEMVMRVGDTLHNAIRESGGLAEGETHYDGTVSEFELGYELNGNTSDQKWHSIDMLLSFYNYDHPTLDYTRYKDHLPYMAPLSGSEAFHGELLSVRCEPTRCYLPYLDGAKIGLEHEGWAASFLLFDEDDDDNRWEEMFSNHEGDGEDNNFLWKNFSDHLGDRTEKDPDYAGKGLLYISPMDGKIHLYRAKHSWWEIDYLALYKGSKDHAGAPEGPEPTVGMRYPRVRYYDTDGDGFLDLIRYELVEYGREEETKTLQREIRLSDYVDRITPPELFDPRSDAKETGFMVENWDKQTFTPERFAGSPVKACFDKMKAYYEGVCEAMWDSASKLYAAAKEYGLNVSENLDADLRTEYSRQERLAMKEYLIPMGYSRHLSAFDLREKYHNGYWLREKVFADICKCERLDRHTLERYFYTAQYDALCDHIKESLG